MKRHLEDESDAEEHGRPRKKQMVARYEMLFDYMNSLPPEMWSAILSELPLRRLAKLAQTNRYFHELADHAFVAVFIRDIVSQLWLPEEIHVRGADGKTTLERDLEEARAASDAERNPVTQAMILFHRGLPRAPSGDAHALKLQMAEIYHGVCARTALSMAFMLRFAPFGLGRPRTAKFLLYDYAKDEALFWIESTRGQRERDDNHKVHYSNSAFNELAQEFLEKYIELGNVEHTTHSIRDLLADRGFDASFFDYYNNHPVTPPSGHSRYGLDRYHAAERDPFVRMVDFLMDIMLDVTPYLVLKVSAPDTGDTYVSIATRGRVMTPDDMSASLQKLLEAPDIRAPPATSSFATGCQLV